MNNKYYYNNENYSNILDKQGGVVFKKITRFIEKYSCASSFILDAGCGTGNLLQQIKSRPNIFGIDISNTFIDKARDKKLNCILYNGSDFPFEDGRFDLVSSLNVVEHVFNLEPFLLESLRVLKQDGFLIIACPNFLSITNNFHWHTSGLKQKGRNLASLIKKLFSRKYSFEKMKTIERKEFCPDDDACNVMNPADIYKWSKKNNLKIEYWSGQTMYKSSRFINFIDKTILKIFFGSCFFVFRKR